MPCIAREDTQAVVTSGDTSEEQSDAENTGTGGKVKRQQMDHIAEKGYVRSCHYGPLHVLVFIQEAMKMPDAKAAVVQKLDRLKKIPAKEINKVRSKSEVIRQAKKDGKTVQFVNWMDLCHLKNAELATHLPDYKERVVFLEDTVKDEEGH